MSTKHKLELDSLDIRNIAQGLREAAFEAVCNDRYVPAITYYQFAAHLAQVVGMPAHAKRDLQRAHEAESAMRIAAIEAAEDAILDEEG